MLLVTPKAGSVIMYITYMYRDLVAASLMLRYSAHAVVSFLWSVTLCDSRYNLTVIIEAFARDVI